MPFATEVRMMTPEAAEMLLRRNTHNRPLIARRVDDLVHIIKSGQWKLTHQGVALDEQGLLQDGQHRLMAISRAGVAVPIMVTTLEENVFDVIDTGRPRSPRDVLALAGVTNAQKLPAAIRLVAHYRSADRDAKMGGSHSRLSNHDFLEVVQAEPEYLAWATRSISTATHLGRSGLASGLLAAMVVIDQDCPDLSDSENAFFDTLSEPILVAADSPIIALRRWLIVTLPGVPGTSRAQLAMYATIRAWNAYIEGRPLSRMAVRLDRDGAPDVSNGGLR